VQNPSLSPADDLTNTTFSGPVSGQCGPSPQPSAPLAGEQGRCGFGPRLPMLVISPFAKSNYVDHDLSNQASTLNFVEYNWHLPGIAGSFDQAQAKVDKSEHVPFDLAGMFEFGNRGSNPALPLNPSTGQPVPAEYGW
jgi:phospholipase C